MKKLISMMILAVCTVFTVTGCGGGYADREEEMETFIENMDEFERIHQEALKMIPNHENGDSYGEIYCVYDHDKRWHPEIWAQNAAISQFIEDYDVMSVSCDDNGLFSVQLNRKSPYCRWGSFQYIPKDYAIKNKEKYDFDYREGDTFFTIHNDGQYYYKKIYQHIKGNWFYVEYEYYKDTGSYSDKELQFLRKMEYEVIPKAQKTSFEEFYALLE